MPEVWAGPECAFVDAGTGMRDQLLETGHADRLADIDDLASLGVRAVRQPVLWGWPDGRPDTDWDWARSRVERLAEAGIRPILGFLHHGFGPAGVDPLAGDYPDRFADFVAEAVHRLPSAWAILPVNEPTTTARFAALYGWWWPFATDRAIFARLLLAQCLAVRAATAVVREGSARRPVIVNEDLGHAVGPIAARALLDKHERRRWATFDLLTGRVTPDTALWRDLDVSPEARQALTTLTDDPLTPDILGLDYYVTSDRFLIPDRSPLAKALPSVDTELVRVAPQALRGFDGVIDDAWRRYHLPVALTEVHLAGEANDQVSWWGEAWTAAERAVASGIPVRGVTAWASHGASDWDSLLLRRAGNLGSGCFMPGAFGSQRTALGDAVAASAAGRRVVSGPGWWSREDAATTPVDPGGRGSVRRGRHGLGRRGAARRPHGRGTRMQGPHGAVRVLRGHRLSG
jgi:dTDP-4-dehydrorhamnose reductase